ncbi:hypothetical protein HK101_006928, partial [Irineochytrium annulatum]
TRCEQELADRGADSGVGKRGRGHVGASAEVVAEVGGGELSRGEVDGGFAGAKWRKRVKGAAPGKGGR